MTSVSEDAYVVEYLCHLEHESLDTSIDFDVSADDLNLLNNDISLRILDYRST